MGRAGFLTRRAGHGAYPVAVPWLFLLPYMLLTAVFFIYPFVNSIWLALIWLIFCCACSPPGKSRRP